MKVQRTAAILALAATAALGAQAWADQIFSFEDAETVTVETPNAGPQTWLGGIAHINTAYQRTEGALTRYEPTQGYIWGQSFGSDSSHPDGFSNHSRSTIGATDGSYSMHVNEPDGGFAWGTQVLFNDVNDPRWAQLTTGTKYMIDISTPGGAEPNGLPSYQVGFGAVNFSAGFLDSYNPANVGRYNQFASGPASQTELNTQTYIYDFGGQMISAAGSLWPGLQEFVILHFNRNSEIPAPPLPAIPADYYYDNFRVINEAPTRPTWKVVGTADWTNASNWNNGVPNGVSAPAIFYGLGAGVGTNAVNATVNLASAVNVGSIIFDAQMTSYQYNAADGTLPNVDALPAIVNYTISGGGSLTFDVASGIAEVYVLAGNQSINMPVTVNDSMTLDTIAGFGPDGNTTLPGGGRYSNVARPSLTFGSTLSLTGAVNLTTRGAGSFNFNGNISGAAAGLVFNGGRVTLGGNVNVAAVSIAPAARVTMTPSATNVLRTKTLTIGNGSLASSLDLTNNRMVIDHDGTSPLANVAAMISSAYAGGTWTGPGITTSLGDATSFAIGYAEASALTSVPAVFGSVDGTAVLVRFTRYGDADLSGTVGLDDFNALASNFNTAGKGWSQGNFNYDPSGNVNLDDFNLLAGNFNLSAAGPQVTPEDWAALAAAIPEPSALLLGVPALAGMGMLRRRRH